jgi:O-antigen/teichoic acid export membrane protein
MRNTAARAAGEIVGKLASLVLFAVLAREVGTSGLGAFVFALAWAAMSVEPVGLGVDRYLLRRIAKERTALGTYLFNALALKLSRSLPLIAASLVAINLLDYGSETRRAVYVLTLALLLESVTRTLVSVFNAFERGGLIATAIVVQRISTAALGIAALAAGGGVVAVCVAYLVGVTLRLGLALRQLRRHIGLPPMTFPREGRAELRSRSAPFAVQDVFQLVLGKVDVVILSLMASDSVVGIYGAAYRLLEATGFLTTSMVGAFSAQYTYLGPDTRPTVRGVFQRSLKLSLSVLVPCAVTFAVLATPLCRLFFGAEFEDAADPLRILAPVVVLYGLVVLSTSLIVSRRSPMAIVPTIGAVAALNVALNLVLIPEYEDTGAATAMLLAEIAFAAVAVTVAVRTVQGVDWPQMLGAPLVAGAAMALAMLPLDGLPALALVAGAAAYVIVFVAVERRVSPADLEFAKGVAARLLTRAGRGSGRARAPGAPVPEAAAKAADGAHEGGPEPAAHEGASVVPGEDGVRLAGDGEREPSQ